MAISFPRGLPSDSFGNVSFDLMRYESVVHLRNHQTQVDERADPRWIASFQSRPLLPAVNPGDRLIMGQWQAFYNSLRGNDQTLLGYDPAFEYPALYPGGVGLGGWSGVASVTSVAAFSLSVYSSTFPGSFTVSPGDYVSLHYNGNYSLHQILEARAASGSSLTGLTVEPFIDTTRFPASGTTATFVRAVCEMQRISGSWSGPKDRSEASPCGFQAIQLMH